MDRFTINHWRDEDHEASLLIAAIRAVYTARSKPHPDAQPVFEVKLIADGWGYGKSLTGVIAYIAHHFDTSQASGERVTVNLDLTEDADREYLGWDKGERVHVGIGEIEWIAQRGWVATVTESEIEAAS